jgi:hypothetical protein
MNHILRTKILLTMQAVLIGNVTRHINAVAVSWDSSLLKVRYFCQSPLTLENDEEFSCIETELIAHLPEFTISYESQLAPLSEKLIIRDDEVLVFARAKDSG